MLPPLTVVVVDPHAPMARAVTHLLDATPGIEVVAQALDLVHAGRLLRRHRPHVLVLDVATFGGDLRGVGLLKERSPLTAVVLVGMTARTAWLTSVERLERLTYLPKHSTAAMWIEAVRRAGGTAELGLMSDAAG